MDLFSHLEKIIPTVTIRPLSFIISPYGSGDIFLIPLQLASLGYEVHVGVDTSELADFCQNHREVKNKSQSFGSIKYHSFNDIIPLFSQQSKQKYFVFDQSTSESMTLNSTINYLGSTIMIDLWKHYYDNTTSSNLIVLRKTSTSIINPSKTIIDDYSKAFIYHAIIPCSSIPIIYHTININDINDDAISVRQYLDKDVKQLYTEHIPGEVHEDPTTASVSFSDLLHSEKGTYRVIGPDDPALKGKPDDLASIKSEYAKENKIKKDEDDRIIKEIDDHLLHNIFNLITVVNNTNNGKKIAVLLPTDDHCNNLYNRLIDKTDIKPVKIIRLYSFTDDDNDEDEDDDKDEDTDFDYLRSKNIKFNELSIINNRYYNAVITKFNILIDSMIDLNNVQTPFGSIRTNLNWSVQFVSNLRASRLGWSQDNSVYKLIDRDHYKKLTSYPVTSVDPLNPFTILKLIEYKYDPKNALKHYQRSDIEYIIKKLEILEFIIYNDDSYRLTSNGLLSLYLPLSVNNAKVLSLLISTEQDITLIRDTIGILSLIDCYNSDYIYYPNRLINDSSNITYFNRLNYHIKHFDQFVGRSDVDSFYKIWYSMVKFQNGSLVLDPRIGMKWAIDHSFHYKPIVQSINIFNQSFIGLFSYYRDFLDLETELNDNIPAIYNPTLIDDLRPLFKEAYNDWIFKFNGDDLKYYYTSGDIMGNYYINMRCFLNSFNFFYRPENRKIDPDIKIGPPDRLIVLLMDSRSEYKQILLGLDLEGNTNKVFLDDESYQRENEESSESENILEQENSWGFKD